MADKTAIEWADATWNPTVGCEIVSPGCTNCYAMRMAARCEAMGITHYAGTTRKVKSHTVWTGQINVAPDHILTQPLRWKRPRRIFVNSMSDLFAEGVDDATIDKVFAVMMLAPQHTFQVLTKRPERMRAYVSDSRTPFRVAKSMATIGDQPSGPEEMRPVEGFPGYLVSSHGSVYSERRGPRKRLRPDAGEQGHLRVHLFREGGPRRGERHLVHRLVLTAFDGPPPSKESQGRHLDGEPSHNAISNLTWGDQSANWGDSRQHGSFRRHAKLTDKQVAEIKSRFEHGESAESLGRAYPVSATQVRNIVSGRQWAVAAPIEWPLPNVWKGVSVEDQARADERIPILLDTPAAVRWISAEPLLGPISFLNCSDGLRPKWRLEPGQYDMLGGSWWAAVGDPDYEARTAEWDLPHLDWVIAGGESGPGARPVHPDWVRKIRDDCAAAGVAFLFKQWGNWLPGEVYSIANEGGYCRHQDGTQNAHRGAEDFWWAGGSFGGVICSHVGKKAAGRLLDGVEHNGYPS